MIELDEFGHAMWIHKEIPNIVLECKQKYIIENKVKDESNLWSSEFETYKTTNKNRKETLYV